MHFRVSALDARHYRWVLINDVQIVLAEAIIQRCLDLIPFRRRHEECLCLAARNRAMLSKKLPDFAPVLTLIPKVVAFFWSQALHYRHPFFSARSTVSSAAISSARDGFG